MGFKGNTNVVNMTDDQNIGGVKAFNNDVVIENTSDFSPNFILVAHNSGRQSRLVETSNGLSIYEGTGGYLDELYAGASDTNNTVVTTTGKNKAKNGYFKLGNGLIVQWGEYSGNADSTITFATPFSNTNYSISITNSSSAGTLKSGPSIKIQYTTNVTVKIDTSISGVYWIAIGY